MTTGQQDISLRKPPRQARAQATVSAILEAAARILETEGLSGVNTNAIAARAGVSVGSLYQYFPSKEAVLSALLQRERQTLHLELERAIAAGADAEFGLAVRGLLEVAAAHQLARPALARQLEYVEASLPLEAQTDAVNARTADLIAGFLQGRWLAQPGIAARDIAAMSRGLSDAAGMAGETDGAALVDRLYPAVMGYLAQVS